MYVLFCAFDKNKAPIGANLKKNKKNPQRIKDCFQPGLQQSNSFLLVLLKPLSKHS